MLELSIGADMHVIVRPGTRPALELASRRFMHAIDSHLQRPGRDWERPGDDLQVIQRRGLQCEVNFKTL